MEATRGRERKSVTYPALRITQGFLILKHSAPLSSRGSSFAQWQWSREILFRTGCSGIRLSLTHTLLIESCQKTFLFFPLRVSGRNTATRAHCTGFTLTCWSGSVVAILPHICFDSILTSPTLLTFKTMALVSGPGRAAGSRLDEELYVQKHVAYIKNLDTVRDSCSFSSYCKRGWLTGDA